MIAKSSFTFLKSYNTEFTKVKLNRGMNAHPGIDFQYLNSIII